MNIKNFLIGLVMGACDLVPGVSGGTIAFITGIYDKFLGSIKSLLTYNTLKDALGFRLKKIRTEHNLSFLFTLFGGIVLSILTFSSLIHSLLENSPHLLYGLFLGFIISSLALLVQQKTQRRTGDILSLVVGILIGIIIFLLPSYGGNPSAFLVFLSGAVAISAMILPGISGSYILLLFGTYGTILGALHNKDIFLISFFLLGILVGLSTFVRVVSWSLKTYPHKTIAVLIGLMIGTLPKLWPRQNFDSGILLSPFDYYQSPEIYFVTFLFLVGFLGSYFFLRFLGKK